MHQRTKDINKAIAHAKRRDNHRCIVTSFGTDDCPIDGAHLLPRNSPWPLNDPTNPDYIMTLARHVHKDYDSHTDPIRKLLWLKRNGLNVFYRRLAVILGESVDI